MTTETAAIPFTRQHTRQPLRHDAVRDLHFADCACGRSGRGAITAGAAVRDHLDHTHSAANLTPVQAAMLRGAVDGDGSLPEELTPRTARAMLGRGLIAERSDDWYEITPVGRGVFAEWQQRNPRTRGWKA